MTTDYRIKAAENAATDWLFNHGDKEQLIAELYALGFLYCSYEPPHDKAWLGVSGVMILEDRDNAGETVTLHL